MKDKISTREVISGLRKGYREGGRKVGFTSGVFDLLHPGHVEYLEKAKSLVDVLLVAVNSDASVRANKGDTRPIVPERDRAEVVAGLSCVDHVFIFDEENNHENVRALQPDVYVKAGDYSPDKLTSKEIVEGYGGRVEIVPLRKGLSSTTIIRKIEAQLKTLEGEQITHERRPAIFVDRDGTINEHVEYLSEPERFKEIPGSFHALKALRDLGYRIIVVTNQPGIGLGYFSKEDFFAVNREMFSQATAAGLSIDKVYFCPHSKADHCRCRKPLPYLLHRATVEINIDLARSYVIGDMTSDIELARAAGCASVLVRTGRGGKDGICDVKADICAADLGEAARVISERGPVPVEKVPVRNLDREEDRLLEAVGKLACTLGHDFNNILGSVLACVDLIRQKTSRESGESTVETSLRILDKAVQNGLALTTKIRSYTRPGEISTESLSLRRCIESVIEVIRSTRAEKCNIVLVCAEDYNVRVAGVTIVQMLLQLSENSLEAMQHLAERFILFHVERVVLAGASEQLELPPGAYAKVALIDHGKGIGAEQKEAVFQPFFSTKSRGVGKGLGLSMSMAKAVMKKHGGSITIASTEGVGTAISLYFPLSK